MAKSSAPTAEEIHASEKDILAFRRASLNNDVRRVNVCVCTVPRLGEKILGVKGCMNCGKPTSDLVGFNS